MKTANRPLDPQALALQIAETEIRRTVNDGYFSFKPKTSLNEDVKRIIKRAVKQIRIPALRSAAIRSLLSFYRQLWEQTERLFARKRMVLLLLLALSGDKVAVEKNGRTRQIPKTDAAKGLQGLGYDVSGGSSPRIYGVPVQRYSEDYFKEQVKPVYERLLSEFPKDPDDISGRNSLRNRAEMEVRYNAHNEQIEDLKAAGVKLVIASAHSDCSNRCQPWQGRVYSLDGTRGTTEDGRKYVPLEEATDVFYTTKAGITYKNGLLGFNCRHYLVPYKPGYRFPKLPVKDERREYAITRKQRELEREVRRAKVEAELCRRGTKEGYKEALIEAKAATRRYEAYCRRMGRTFYPSRITIL